MIAFFYASQLLLGQTPAPCVPTGQPAAPEAAAPAAGRGQQGRGGPAERIPRDAAVVAIPGVVAPGATWKKIWQRGGNSADGILADKDGNALVAQEDFDTVLRIDKNDNPSVVVLNAKGVGSLS